MSLHSSVRNIILSVPGVITRIHFGPVEVDDIQSVMTLSRRGDLSQNTVKPLI